MLPVQMSSSGKEGSITSCLFSKVRNGAKKTHGRVKESTEVIEEAANRNEIVIYYPGLDVPILPQMQTKSEKAESLFSTVKNIRGVAGPMHP